MKRNKLDIYNSRRLIRTYGFNIFFLLPAFQYAMGKHNLIRIQDFIINQYTHR